MKKFASIGECMVQLLQQEDGRYIRNYAGDTHSAAQYLAWLGREQNITSSYVTVLGQDKFGTQMLADWQDKGLDTSLVMTTAQKNTGLYFADTDKQGHRDYTYYRSDAAAKLIFRMPQSASIMSDLQLYDMIYSSAITLMILNDEDRQKLVDLYQSSQARGIQTAFDTNYRPAGWQSDKEARKWIDAILAYTDIAFPTDDENAALYGDKSAEQTAKRIHKAGAKEVVVKCGSEGCLIKTDKEQIHVASVPNVKVRDTTAAGDSFNAGYLYARFNDKLLYEAAAFGHEVASQVIQYQGALIDPVLLPSLTS